MATLLVNEFSGYGVQSGGVAANAPIVPELTNQSIAFTSSTQSAEFNTDTALIRVEADAVAHVAFGASPTATADGIKIAANTPTFFSVTGGDKVAAYDGATSRLALKGGGFLKLKSGDCLLLKEG